MNHPAGHQTLPASARSSTGLPRSQSSRGADALGIIALPIGSGSRRPAERPTATAAAAAAAAAAATLAAKRVQRQQQHAKHFITQTTRGGFTSYTASRVNDLPAEAILRDRAIATEAHEDHRRRTIVVERDRSHGGSFGFTLQTYGIRHRDDSEIELITYVDSVEAFGPAARAGMRAGDVILSINGEDVESVDHNRLIQMIQACGHAMRLVVLFEDCVRRVALHVKLMQLKRSYHQKIMEYNHYVEAERNMLETLRNKGVNTSSLLNGSAELLPLNASSTDVLFPFRKHSKSFNRLGVSHSKSESRLLSDSASSIVLSGGGGDIRACSAAAAQITGTTRGPPTSQYSHCGGGPTCVDSSASCSTLPRLGGARHRSSARSLPASTAVTPVSSLDGLEQGGIHFKAHRTCSTDFSDNVSTDGGLSSTEELEDEDGTAAADAPSLTPPPVKPPLPPKVPVSNTCLSNTGKYFQAQEQLANRSSLATEHNICIATASHSLVTGKPASCYSNVNEELPSDIPPSLPPKRSQHLHHLQHASSAAKTPTAGAAMSGVASDQLRSDVVTRL